MAGRLAGKHALVTGAGQGIGRAVALAFAEEGARVVATSRTLSKMEDLPDLQPAIEPFALDVTQGDEVARVVAEAGQVDILFNCAGWVHTGTILDCSEEDWTKSLHHNATSMFYTIRAVLPGMLERGTGSIINVASVASSLTGVADRFAYGASKAAVIGMTKAVARDFIRTGVRCNALCPGTTLTPSLEERIRSSENPEDMRQRFTERQPMGRLGKVEEMAAAAVYLASDESAFTTGTVIVVDGGQTL
ncbi:2-keto-3-deoxy-L-fuconate dehydrogenase [Mesorhizobium sp. J18]|uniref:SDR family oxidoreductase n=1 Tax=Mesorhizobium sp. J18 TaxID=935263 RepID=UPI001199AB6D|nr:SDR family oxidoreductase [Mesorhizobium sp. J18]TWG97941.1 2-keto-3-deoxy-L-fuconate dehydrogenase [Mesorhizobium sp. J18]